MNATATVLPYPRMQAYLDRLPDAERSYPACKIRAGLVNISLEVQPFPLRAETPEWLRTFVEEKRPATSLLSLVQCNAWVLASVDTVFGGSVPRYLDFNYTVNRKFAEHRMYALLYRMVTPSFVMHTMPTAFRHLMPGVNVTLDARVGGGTVVLHFPANLYESVLLEGWGAALRAMVENAGGSAPSTKLLDHTKSSARYDVSWTV